VTIAGDRPQDVGREHHRRGGPSPETEELLERYRAAMRAELEDLLGEIRPASGQLGAFDGDAPKPARPSLEGRRALWDLAIKIGRELAAAPEPIGAPSGSEPAAVPGPRKRSRSAPRLTVAQRKSLGAAP
jgi:hypothetical protein